MGRGGVERRDTYLGSLEGLGSSCNPSRLGLGLGLGLYKKKEVRARPCGRRRGTKLKRAHAR